jgi:hypothetical protein
MSMRAQIEAFVKEQLAAAGSVDVPAADIERLVDAIEQKIDRREAGIVDLDLEREIRAEEAFLAQVAAKFPGCDLSTLRWVNDHWEIG